MFGLFKRKPACKHSWDITDVWEVTGYTSMVKMFSLYGLTKGVDVE